MANDNIIVALTDYKNQFGSKWNSKIYRGGFNKSKLIEEFSKLGYKLVFKKFFDFKSSSYLKPINIIYTSSEEKGFIYKNYIEDIVLSAEYNGHNVVPKYKFLRANNNKVFMELIKKKLISENVCSLSSLSFATLEEAMNINLKYPFVVKTSEGAMSTGVFLAKNRREFLSFIKKKCDFNILDYLHELIRHYKHTGYFRNSSYKRKFIIQSYIPKLKSDYKILIFLDKYYVFERPVRKNDFRASGSGNKNYLFGSKVKLPKGILDYSKKIYDLINTPTLSIDIAYDGNSFYLIEFQAIYFGTVGHAKSDGYYKLTSNKWIFENKILSIEKVYAESFENKLI